VINEIIAHATAAIYFDKDVDTIFEIGGQDAKYTSLANGVAQDYAMNEACSAGTGSFLEESAKETLAIEMTDIAELAMNSENPPNFNEQCAAFISSDVKNALHEGFNKKDILAGLVYSICMNYTNRVKGNRQVGKKIFMQGGVCYNRAVPIAMAALTGQKIIVPPEPGLMGAFGVALEIKNRQEKNLFKEKEFKLSELALREIEYGESFRCKGDQCDRNCKITTLKIANKTYPFGGACNRYTNSQEKGKNIDLVKDREKLIFEKYATLQGMGKKTIGINRSLLVESFYPLYYNFFTKLSFQVVLPDTVDAEGINKKGAEFCYPVEISHGYMQNLIDKNPDYFFLPHLKNLDVDHASCTCPLIQGEPYYLRSAFKELNGRVIEPVMNFGNGYSQDQFISIGKRLGCDTKKSSEAFHFALEKQMSCQKEMKEIGKKILEDLEKDSTKIGMVIFGRSYNALSEKANMNVPRKFASRGIITIPFDFLPYESENPQEHMYWSTGQMILKAAKFVKKHPQLYATFITNFNCGPDSFIITYFRNIMGKKPSLTLELDSHSSDVGIDTRIEAALDIIKGNQELGIGCQIEKKFNAARVEGNFVITSDGKKLPFTHERVKLLVPSMGDLFSKFMVACLRTKGWRAEAVKVPDKEVLRLGRAHTTCKECLPLILTTGSLLHAAKEKDNEVIVYFMPKFFGPCRFGQYGIFLEQLISKNKIKDVAILASDSRRCYDEFPAIRGVTAVILSDILTDIENALKVVAVDKDSSLDVFYREVDKLIASFADGGYLRQIKKSIEALNKIPTKLRIDEAKTIYIIGEIYVRRDSFSCQDLIDKLVSQGFVVKIAPVMEWLQYASFLSKNRLVDLDQTWKEFFSLKFRSIALSRFEKIVRNMFSKCKLYSGEPVDIDSIVEHAEHLINPRLTGEAILTVGSALNEAGHVCGIISIGPFGCMPSRIAEAILSKEVKEGGLSHLPLLAIETDGNPFPQIIESKLESFCLRADRIHEIKNPHLKW